MIVKSVAVNKVVISPTVPLLFIIFLTGSIYKTVTFLAAAEIVFVSFVVVPVFPVKTKEADADVSLLMQWIIVGRVKSICDVSDVGINIDLSSNPCTASPKSF